MVERAKILFPMSQIGAITDEQRAELISSSRLAGKYDEAVDRESAFEKILKQREAEAAEAAKAKAAEAEAEERERAAKAEAKGSRSSSTKKSVLATVLGTAVTYFAKTVATQLARNLTKKTKKK